MKPLRLFEEVRIRNNQDAKIKRIIKKHFDKSIKEIKKSELKCYDYQDLINLYENIIEDIN